MKDESLLESKGPIFVATALVAMVVFASFLIVRGHSEWGNGENHQAVVAASSPIQVAKAEKSY
jgi:hypothetical protein